MLFIMNWEYEYSSSNVQNLSRMYCTKQRPYRDVQYRTVRISFIEVLPPKNRTNFVFDAFQPIWKQYYIFFSKYKQSKNVAVGLMFAISLSSHVMAICINIKNWFIYKHTALKLVSFHSLSWNIYFTYNIYISVTFKRKMSEKHLKNGNYMSETALKTILT